MNRCAVQFILFFVVTVALGSNPANCALPGDINQDYDVYLDDAILGLQIVSGVIPDLYPIDPDIDVNQDGKIGQAEVIFILQSVANANLYYVTKSGNNSNPGTQALPWKTISKAANSLTAGDTVYIGAGTYQERVIPAQSGTAGNYITYTAIPGDVVIIDGSSLTLPPYESGLVHIEDRNYIKISGLTVQNVGPNQNNAGIYIDNANNIIINKNKTYNTTSSGIGVWGSTNVSIISNEVELACNDGEQECITVGETAGFEVKNNHVHHNGPGTNGGEGIDVKDGSSAGIVSNNHIHDLSRLGIYVDAWDKHTHAIEINGNRVYNCENDGIVLTSEMGGLLENVSVSNNLAYDNMYNGIAVTPNGPVAQPPMKNITVMNNTLYNNGDSTIPNPWGGGIVVDNPNIQTLVIRNNIISQNLLYQILMDVTVTDLSVDHNLIYGFRNYSNEIKGSSVVEGNPLLLGPSAGNFHLNSNSPAIDTGSSVNAPVIDIEFTSRPQLQGYDIGAYEYKE